MQTQLLAASRDALSMIVPGSGSLTLSARRSGTRTILDRVRFEGIARCSRAFPDGDAARVVLSQLGPGVVRGDAVAIAGHVGAGAHLIVTSQSATRLLGGPRPAGATADWTLDDGAILELISEPLVASADSDYAGQTHIALAASALVLATDVACVPRAARVRLRTIVTRGGRELLYDAFEPAAAAPQTVGTLTLVGVPTHRIAPLVAELDRAADRLGLHAGVGVLADGAMARVLGPDIWDVRSALAHLRAAAWTVLSVKSSAGP